MATMAIPAPTSSRPVTEGSGVEVTPTSAVLKLKSSAVWEGKSKPYPLGLANCITASLELIEGGPHVSEEKAA